MELDEFIDIFDGADVEANKKEFSAGLVEELVVYPSVGKVEIVIGYLESQSIPLYYFATSLDILKSTTPATYDLLSLPFYNEILSLATNSSGLTFEEYKGKMEEIFMKEVK